MSQDRARHFAPRLLDHGAPLNALLSAEENRASDRAQGWVYRFYAADREALYTGVTSGPPFRWKAHRKNAEWWPLARYVAVSFYASHESAIRAETAGIKAERPRFNRQGIKPRTHVSLHLTDGAEAVARELHKVASPEFVRELLQHLAEPECFPQPLPPPAPKFPGR
ncbi:GIY-YIG nuclease family protein [Streptomyces anulatus]|uniref:GIY-YIG nuclease family protein n=1 Tax=Streptomyces anulatus TaxID=1892 RepID=UPI00342C30DC